MFKKQEGITLVALVITIIVLLILAGVSISLVVGDNGVLTQASTAVVTNKAADAREALNMALASTETIYYGKWTSNTNVKRVDVYAGTNSTLKAQLANLGYEIVTLDPDTHVSEGETTLTAVPSGAMVLRSTSSGETFSFTTVSVDETTGKATISGKLNVYDATGTLIGEITL